jgi:hypothetical protein
VSVEGPQTRGTERESADQSSDVPDDPRAEPIETVETLTDENSFPADDATPKMVGDDVTENPDDGGMEGLPGPSSDVPSEPPG